MNKHYNLQDVNLQERKLLRPSQIKKAVFAGGCFWCVEAAFNGLTGVVQVVSGYTGGKTANPTYEQVSAGTTGHYEAIQVNYDPKLITYSQLLERFWKNIDPFDYYGQFADHGSQYQTAVFYGTENERQAAERSKQELQKKFSKPIATRILPLNAFYPAEEYHQDFYRKSPVQYRAYELGSGRKQKLKMIWG